MQHETGANMDKDIEYIKQLEEEIANYKQIIANLEQTITDLQTQSLAANILLKDLEPGNIV